MRVFALLALAVLIAGCDSSQSFDVSGLVGTYSGIEILTEADGSTDMDDDVVVRVSSDESDGTLDVRVDQLLYEGTYDEDGATLAFEEDGAFYTFDVAPDGEIAGSGLFTGDGLAGTIDITGEWTPDRFNLTLRATYTSVPDGGEIEVGDTASLETRTTRDD